MNGGTGPRFGLSDSLATLARTWLAAWSVPGRRKLLFLTNPLDATRYLEFGYLLRFLKTQGLEPGRVLDVSSPVLIAHLLGRLGHDVVKTDIDAREGRFVDGQRVVFEQEDARRLSFGDGSFDLVVSISVIEHIHRDYGLAVQEMLRVVKPGGHVYLTFPVAAEPVEEWMDEEIYAAQAKSGDRVFFQYRFGPDQYREILEQLGTWATVASEAVFWERRDGDYDRLVDRLRATKGPDGVRHLRAALLNLTAGPRFFEKRPGSFERAKAFGNAQLILRKEAGWSGAARSADME